MLQTQEYLFGHGLEALVKNHKIDVTIHPSLPLVLFGYNAVETRKANLQYHEITRECRSLVLEKDTWKLISRSFRRFFNLGEYEEKDFNWDSFYYQEKLDGSLISLYNYNGRWFIRTSGSFAEGKVYNECDHTWSSLVFYILGHVKLKLLNPQYTYVFELTSPYNQVVKLHKESSLTLLSIFDNLDGVELGITYSDYVAKDLEVARPQIFHFVNIKEALTWLETQPADFEGFVLMDTNFNRYKCKNSQYLMAHRLKNNGNFRPKYLISLILNNNQEKDEFLTYFKELKEKWLLYENEINVLFDKADLLYNNLNNLEQKDFALSIKDEEFHIKSILFTSRKQKIAPSSNKNGFESLLIKYFENKKENADLQE